MCVTGAHHKDDPFHKAHPSHVLESGCWDYLPGQDPRNDPGLNVPPVAGVQSNAITSGPGSRAFQKK
jgi:hypothetical protein